jgi:hypothetical protein
VPGIGAEQLLRQAVPGIGAGIWRRMPAVDFYETVLAEIFGLHLIRVNCNFINIIFNCFLVPSKPMIVSITDITEIIISNLG